MDVSKYLDYKSYLEIQYDKPINEFVNIISKKNLMN